jgi:polysaccharide deacetylase family protein (PEP-CTERM system associated)
MEGLSSHPLNGTSANGVGRVSNPAGGVGRIGNPSYFPERIGNPSYEDRGNNDPSGAAQIILSFDVEEHYRIEAAAGLTIPEDLKAHYRGRLEPSTAWLVDRLAEYGIQATFFILGEIARDHPRLVRSIHGAGHEVASHGWDHQRVHQLDPASFRQDVRWSKDALEQVTGEPVVGYRAPTFSIVRQTAWAIDELAELGMRYDSSIYPVRHDRYGIPEAPRVPFMARGVKHSLVEIPPATLRYFKTNIPIGGGGYFRLFPRFLLEKALGQVRRECDPPVGMLYFHPWEFDPKQERLPLGLLSRFRTYCGLYRSRGRLKTILGRRRYVRAVDIAARLAQAALPHFNLLPTSANGTAGYPAIAATPALLPDGNETLQPAYVMR